MHNRRCTATRLGSPPSSTPTPASARDRTTCPGWSATAESFLQSQPNCQLATTPPLTILRARGIHLAIWRVRSAEHRSMVSLVHLLLHASVQIVHPHPRIIRGSGHKAIAQEWVERGGGRGVRQRDGHGRVLAENVEEMDLVAGGDGKGAAAVGKFHGGDGVFEIQTGRLRQCSQVPPSAREPHGVSQCRVDWTHLTMPSSAALTPTAPPCASSQTSDRTVPLQESPSGLLPNTRGSASGRPRSNSRIFFSFPP